MKPWYSSKWLWFNVVMGVVAGTEAALEVFQPLVPVNVWPWFVAFVTTVNIVLRAIRMAEQASSLKSRADDLRPRLRDRYHDE